MAVINKRFLHAIGVELSDAEAEMLSTHVEETLQKRVIEEVTDSLDGAQAEQLLAMAERDDPAISDWLAQNIPELPEIIQDEVDILLGELAENRDRLSNGS